MKKAVVRFEAGDFDDIIPNADGSTWVEIPGSVGGQGKQYLNPDRTCTSKTATYMESWPDRGDAALDTGDGTFRFADAPRLVYQLLVNEPGTYRVWVRLAADSGTSNSFYLRIRETAADNWWRWNPKNDSGDFTDSWQGSGAFRELRSQGVPVTPHALREATAGLAKKHHQYELFELLYEDISSSIDTEEEIRARYEGQWEAFKHARAHALENTRLYLSICNDLDVYVATSMRVREHFRGMARACDAIFSDKRLANYNVRYFDPTLSAADHHEDKGIIECLMVKTAKVVLYFAQHKESLGKVSEYAMALSLGKPVIILCPDDERR